MIADEFGNVNILLVWNWWEDHAGGFLADTIMVASRNPKQKSVTLVSVPRDLYIYHKDLNIKWKINSLFASAYYRLRDFGDLTDEKEIHSLKMNYASETLASKLEDITGLEIKYFAVIDFNKFVEFVDNIGGLDIFVPKRLYDSEYPEWKWYTTFVLDAGSQHLDWATALKYARSRHSTSDFSRAGRQQQIIKAIIDKLTKWEELSKVSRVKELYQDYTKMVHTNISLKEILWMMWEKDNLENIFSFVFTTECSYRDHSLTTPWCFLYVPDRNAFGGSSVMLTNWATIWNVSFYDYTQNFVFFVAHNQWYLKESSNIVIQNWIDAKVARSLWFSPSGHASNLAVKLKKYAFGVVDVKNSDSPLEQTSVYLSWELDKQYNTIEILKSFCDISNVYTWQTLETWVDMLLILWNDYLEKMWSKSFNFEM